jgi:hypothetical protein
VPQPIIECSPRRVCHLAFRREPLPCGFDQVICPLVVAAASSEIREGRERDRDPAVVLDRGR